MFCPVCFRHHVHLVWDYKWEMMFIRCWVYIAVNPFWEYTLVQSLWTCISLMQTGVFCFFAGGSDILNFNWHVWQWKEEAMLCEIHMHDFKSRIWQDFVAYNTRPVSVHLAMAWVGCSFNSFHLFAQFKTTTKSHENCVFLYPFSNMAGSAQNNNKKLYFNFYTSKLYGLTGMGLCFWKWPILHAVIYCQIGELRRCVKVKVAMGLPCPE